MDGTNGFVVAASGTWIYDGLLPLPVDVVGVDRDLWNDIGVEDGDEDEPQPLGPDGLLYYVRFRAAGQDRYPWPEGAAFDDLDAAKRSAEAQAPSPVVWH